MGLFYNFLCVGLGSCIGGMLRYAATFLPFLRSVKGFPYPTLAVNLLGCLLIGLLLGLFDQSKINTTLKLLLATGLLGGFTTFSSFSFELLYLIRDHQLWWAAAYAGISLCGGVFLCYLAYMAVISHI